MRSFACFGASERPPPRCAPARSGRRARGIGGRCWWRAGSGGSWASKRFSTARVAAGRRMVGPCSDRALVLVANRLCAPTSEHGLARWLETDFVCDRAGRRWMPAWRAEAERRTSRLPRVRVELRQLKQWYRTLDQLAARKADIERELYLRLRDLFSLKVDLALYDLTSTYFEGHGPPTPGAHG